MRAWFAAVAIVTAAPAAAQTVDCQPPPRPIIPDGATADLETLRAARTRVDDYMDRMQAMVDCLERVRQEAVAETDAVVDEWLRAVDAFEKRPK